MLDDDTMHDIAASAWELGNKRLFSVMVKAITDEAYSLKYKIVKASSHDIKAADMLKFSHAVAMARLMDVYPELSNSEAQMIVSRQIEEGYARRLLEIILPCFLLKGIALSRCDGLAVGGLAPVSPDTQAVAV